LLLRHQCILHAMKPSNLSYTIEDLRSVARQS
jgi:hypothetical protein